MQTNGSRSEWLFWIRQNYSDLKGSGSAILICSENIILCILYTMLLYQNYYYYCIYIPSCVRWRRGRRLRHDGEELFRLRQHQLQDCQQDPVSQDYVTNICNMHGPHRGTASPHAPVFLTVLSVHLLYCLPYYNIACTYLLLTDDYTRQLLYPSISQWVQSLWFMTARAVSIYPTISQCLSVPAY